MLNILLVACCARMGDDNTKDCEQICARTNSTENDGYNTELCIRMCVKMMDSIRSMKALKLLTNYEDPETNCAERFMNEREVLEMKLKSSEIDNKYIIERLNDLYNKSEKNSSDTVIVMCLEGVIIIMYLMKPVIMYFIQARYNAPAPHDGCRNVLTEEDVIEAVEKVESENKGVRIEFV